MNGGYLRARNTTAQTNCAVCECPEGWGGVDCSGMSAMLSLKQVTSSDCLACILKQFMLLTQTLFASAALAIYLVARQTMAQQSASPCFERAKEAAHPGRAFTSFHQDAAFTIACATACPCMLRLLCHNAMQPLLSLLPSCCHQILQVAKVLFEVSAIRRVTCYAICLGVCIAVCVYPVKTGFP